METHDPSAIYSLITAERARNETLQAELLQLYKSLKLVQNENNSMVCLSGFPAVPFAFCYYEIRSTICEELSAKLNFSTTTSIYRVLAPVCHIRVIIFSQLSQWYYTVCRLVKRHQSGTSCRFLLVTSRCNQISALAPLPLLYLPLIQ